MEEGPESIEISPGLGGNPWTGESASPDSSGPLLSGSVSTLGLDSDNALGMASPEEQGKGSNVGWFFAGLILAPAAMWLTSAITMEIGFGMLGQTEEIFVLIAFLVWPAGLIAGVVWSFTKGNKYFAIGMITTLIGVPVVLFLGFFVLLMMYGF